MIYVLWALCIPVFSTEPSDSSTLHLQQLQNRAGLQASATASARQHQDHVFDSIQRLAAEGHATARELDSVDFKRQILGRQQQQITYLADQLHGIYNSSAGVKSQDYLLLIPLPVLHEIDPIKTGFVQVPLSGAAGLEIAEKSKQLSSELYRHQDFRADALAEKIKRLSAIVDPNRREIAQLKRHHAALNIHALTGMQIAPMLLNEDEHWEIDGQKHFAETLIPSIVQQVMALRTQLTVIEYEAKIQQSKRDAQRLQLLDRTSRTPYELLSRDQTIDHFQGGIQQLTATRTVAEKLYDLKRTIEFRSRHLNSQLRHAVTYGQKLQKLANSDPFFQQESLDANQAAILVKARQNLLDYEKTMLEAVIDYNQSEQLDSDVRERRLQRLLTLAVDHEARNVVSVLLIQQAGHRASVLQRLMNDGDASWWEWKKADAEWKSLQQDHKHAQLHQQAMQLALEAVQTFGAGNVSAEPALFAASDQN